MSVSQVVYKCFDPFHNNCSQNRLPKMHSNFYHSYLYYLSTNMQPAFSQVPLSPHPSPFSYGNFLKISEDQFPQSNQSPLSLDHSSTTTIFKPQNCNELEFQGKSLKQGFSPFEKLSPETDLNISPEFADNLVFAQQMTSSSGTAKTTPIILIPIRAPTNIQIKSGNDENKSQLKVEVQREEPRTKGIIESPQVYYSSLLQKIGKEDGYFETTDDLIRKMLMKQHRAKLQKLRGLNKQKRNRKTSKTKVQLEKDSNSTPSSKLKPRTHRIQKKPSTNLSGPSLNSLSSPNTGQ